MADIYDELRENPMTRFIKIGTRVIGLDQIAAADFESVDREGKLCTEISLTSTESLFFYEKEAEIISKFLMAGSRTYDLDQIYR